MDIRDIINLINTIDKTDIKNLELEKEDVRLKLSKEGNSKVKNGEVIREDIGRESRINQEKVSLSEKDKNEDLLAKENEDIFIVKSPIVGVFYEAPNPDADPYVKRGSLVEEGDVVCIVEAMKIMNEIEAEISGEIVEILVENEEAVEYNQPLMKIRR